MYSHANSGGEKADTVMNNKLLSLITQRNILLYTEHKNFVSKLLKKQTKKVKKDVKEKA